MKPEETTCSTNSCYKLVKGCSIVKYKLSIYLCSTRWTFW